MKVVIDTNCLISCIGKKSPYRNIFDAFIQQKITLCASNEILPEYEEVFQRFWGEEVTHNLLALFEVSSNFEKVQIYYNFKLIEKDKDDNKFVDAYISSSSIHLISNDNSIVNLKNNAFPPLSIFTLQEFSELLK